MGTNYYASINVCPTCDKPEEEVHIGKNSFGWQFHFHANEAPPIRSKKEWKEFTAKDNVWIFDEYNELVEFDDFWEMVEEKQGSPKNINHCRIVKGTPKTDCERKYIDKRKKSYGEIFCEEHADKVFLDDEGYCLDEEWFR